MLAGLNTTGHEIGGSLGIAVLVTIATAATANASAPATANGIADAFLAAAGLAGVGALIAVLALPSAARFLPRLQLSPESMPIH